MTKTDDTVERNLREKVEAFTNAAGLQQTGLDGDGALHLEVAGQPLSFHIARDREVCLWIGTELGTLPVDGRSSVPWLMQQCFDHWAHGEVTIGLAPESRTVIAYTIVDDGTLKDGVLTEIVAYLVDSTKDLRRRLEISDFPSLTADAAGMAGDASQFDRV